MSLLATPEARLHNKPPVRSGLYQAVWRWHFYAALFVTPFLLVLAVTGGLYVFKPQIEGWLYRDLYRVSPVARQGAPDAQIRAALARFPKARVEAYRPPADSTRSAVIRLRTTDNREMTVAVHPESAAVLGAIENQRGFMQVVRELHGKLLVGKIGQAIQELAASWAVVLIVTGLYLWWPRRGSGLWGAILPRLQASGRVFWRDLHAVTGFWVSGLLFFLILTGLPWSLVSGALIHEAAGRIGKGSPETGLGWNGGGSRTVQSMPLGQGWATTHAQQLAGQASSGASANVAPISLTRVLQIARTQPVQVPFEVRMPVDARGVYSLATDHDSAPEATAFVHLDQYTGKVVKAVTWRDFGPLAKAIAVGVALHEGRYFGWANQALCLIACLGFILMVLAGAVMWWQRRPRGTLGVPPLPADFRPSPVVLGLIALLALLMPLVGASLILVLAGEWLTGNCFSRITRDASS